MTELKKWMEDFLPLNSNCSLITSTAEMSGVHLDISEALFLVSVAQTSINYVYSTYNGPRKKERN